MNATCLNRTRWLVIVPCLLGAVSCAEPQKSVNSDMPRRSVPIPACAVALPARPESQLKFMRQLTDQQFWRLVFPTYIEGKTGLTADSLLCTGESPFGAAEFAGGKPVRGWPLQPQPGDLTFGSGPKRIKIVWFKTHAWDDGTTGGVVALVRADEEFAEVFGVGPYKGSGKDSRFSTERLGGTLVVTAVDEGCKGKALSEPCVSWLRVMVPWHGRLVTQASIATERREQVADGEPSAQGLVSYRLTSAPIFEPTRIRILEQVQAVDATERKLRTAEVERQFDFTDGRLIERQPSLWDLVVGVRQEDGKASAQPSTAVPATTATGETAKGNGAASQAPPSTSARQ